MQFIVKLEHKDFYKNENVFKALYDLGAAVTPTKETLPGPATTEKVSDISDVNLKKVSEEKAQEAEAAPAEETAPAEEAAQDTESPTYTLEEVRKAFGDLSKAKGKDTAKDILSEMGYTKVTEIPTDKYPEAMEKIKAVK